MIFQTPNHVGPQAHQQRMRFQKFGGNFLFDRCHQSRNFPLRATTEIPQHSFTALGILRQGGAKAMDQVMEGLSWVSHDETRNGNVLILLYDDRF